MCTAATLRLYSRPTSIQVRTRSFVQPTFRLSPARSPRVQTAPLQSLTLLTTPARKAQRLLPLMSRIAMGLLTLLRERAARKSRRCPRLPVCHALVAYCSSLMPFYSLSTPPLLCVSIHAHLPQSLTSHVHHCGFGRRPLLRSQFQVRAATRGRTLNFARHQRWPLN